MKLVIIAYNEALDEEVIEALSASGLESFTRWKQVEGKGTKSGYHLGNHIWPGYVNVLMVGTNDENAARLVEELKKLKSQFSHEGVKAFVLPVEETV